MISLWLRESYEKDEKHRRENLNLYELQKKYWELALWLDAPILQDVHKAFGSASCPGLTHKDALIAVRRKFVGKNDPIQPAELYHWEPVKQDSEPSNS